MKRRLKKYSVTVIEIGKFRYNKHITFIKYSIIGVTGVAAHTVVYTIMREVLHVDENISYAAGAFVGMVNNFLLNAFLNFKTGKNKFIYRFIAYVIIGCIGLGVSSIIIYIFTKRLGINEYLIFFIALVISVAIQFDLNKRISFKKSEIEVKEG